MSLAGARAFLERPGHHLLLASRGSAAIGFVSGVETIHPDKGTEMFLYELSVHESARRQGVGVALVAALERLARSRGCYGMWVLADADNDAALRTYARAGGTDEGSPRMIGWTF